MVPYTYMVRPPLPSKTGGSPVSSRIVSEIMSTPENRQYWSAVFLNVAQASMARSSNFQDDEVPASTVPWNFTIFSLGAEYKTFTPHYYIIQVGVP